MKTNALKQLRDQIELKKPFVGILLRKIAKDYGMIEFDKTLEDFNLRRFWELYGGRIE